MLVYCWPPSTTIGNFIPALDQRHVKWCLDHLTFLLVREHDHIFAFGLNFVFVSVQHFNIMVISQPLLCKAKFNQCFLLLGQRRCLIK